MKFCDDEKGTQETKWTWSAILGLQIEPKLGSPSSCSRTRPLTRGHGRNWRKEPVQHHLLQPGLWGKNRPPGCSSSGDISPWVHGAWSFSVNHIPPHPTLVSTFLQHSAPEHPALFMRGGKKSLFTHSLFHPFMFILCMLM